MNREFPQKDGVICKEEMCKVTEAIHELMGSESSHQSNVAHVNKIFDRMDTNADEKGIIHILRKQ